MLYGKPYSRCCISSCNTVSATPDADDDTSYDDKDAQKSLIMMAAIANGMYLQALSVRALSTCPKFSVFKNKYSLVLTGLFNFNIEMSFCRLA